MRPEQKTPKPQNPTKQNQPQIKNQSLHANSSPGHLHRLNQLLRHRGLRRVAREVDAVEAHVRLRQPVHHLFPELALRGGEKRDRDRRVQLLEARRGDPRCADPEEQQLLPQQQPPFSVQNNSGL